MSKDILKSSLYLKKFIADISHINISLLYLPLIELINTTFLDFELYNLRNAKKFIFEMHKKST